MTPVTIFVLWVYLSVPSSFLGIPIGPGWQGRATMWSLEDCERERKTAEFLARFDSKARTVCLPGGEPPPGPIAEQFTRDDLPEEEDFDFQKLKEQKKIEM